MRVEPKRARFLVNLETDSFFLARGDQLMRPAVFFSGDDETVLMERGRFVELIDRVDIDGLSDRQFNHRTE